MIWSIVNVFHKLIQIISQELLGKLEDWNWSSGLTFFIGPNWIDYCPGIVYAQKTKNIEVKIEANHLHRTGSKLVVFHLISLSIWFVKSWQFQVATLYLIWSTSSIAEMISDTFVPDLKLGSYVIWLFFLHLIN
jgi:hypothetical protein